MIFRTETVVYIYIGVCLCMLGFNCLLVIYRRTEGIFLYKHVSRYKKMLDEQYKHIQAGGHAEGVILTKLSKQLRNIKYLQAFQHALTEKSKEDEINSELFIQECKPLFRELVKTYRKRDSTQMAYFAYLMSSCGINMQGQRNEIVDMMRQLISHPSAYCRENALKALYRFGDAKNLYYALRTLSDSGIFHHSKLITDGLMSFEGDSMLLAEMLWEGLEDFTVDFQVSIINYIRMVSPNYKSVFCEMLEMNKYPDKDVKIAFIRYFGKHNYPRVKEVLIRIYENMENRDWEVGAVIVTVLRDYKGKDTIEILTKSLFHQNWYIRYNAAESLEYLDIGFQDLADIYNGKNRYAREMLTYQKQKKQIYERIIQEKSEEASV